jgi:hypothetical protein
LKPRGFSSEPSRGGRTHRCGAAVRRLNDWYWKEVSGARRRGNPDGPGRRRKAKPAASLRTLLDGGGPQLGVHPNGASCGGWATASGRGSPKSTLPSSSARRRERRQRRPWSNGSPRVSLPRTATCMSDEISPAERPSVLARDRGPRAPRDRPADARHHRRHPAGRSQGPLPGHAGRTGHGGRAGPGGVPLSKRPRANPEPFNRVAVYPYRRWIPAADDPSLQALRRLTTTVVFHLQIGGSKGRALFRARQPGRTSGP